MELNCEVWADVDFGHGPVEIRCTKVGEHQHHICNVLLPDPQNEVAPPGNRLTHNVFEKGVQGGR